MASTDGILQWGHDSRGSFVCHEEDGIGSGWGGMQDGNGEAVDSNPTGVRVWSLYRPETKCLSCMRPSKKKAFGAFGAFFSHVSAQQQNVRPHTLRPPSSGCQTS